MRGRDSAFFEAPQNQRQHGAIGGRACDIADGNGGCPFPFGEFAKAGRCDGCVNSAFDGEMRILERGGRSGFEEAIVVTFREVGGQAGLSECEVNVHTWVTLPY